jgi:hypothetical protein
MTDNPIIVGGGMRTIFLTATLLAASSIAQAQSPNAKLPSQAEPPSIASTPAAPNAGNDEVLARRKLEDGGYRDLRNMTPNPDGTYSALGTRRDPPGARPGSQPEVKVDIDASGNIKER